MKAPCLQCLADTNLTLEDWYVIRFWQAARDQVVNLTPYGAERPWLAPRLEGWLAVADLLAIPRGARPWVVDRARELHAVFYGYSGEIPGLFRMPESELAPVEGD